LTDPRQRRAWLNEAVVNLQRLERLLDDCELIRRIVDDEIARQADGRCFAAEQARAKRVKGRDPHAAAVGSEQRFDARAHLFRSLVRESDSQDFMRAGVPIADEVGDAACDDARLAGAGAGEDEQRSVDVKDRFALFGVEGIEELH